MRCGRTLLSRPQAPRLPFQLSQCRAVVRPRNPEARPAFLRAQPDDAEYFQNLQEISFTPDQRLRPGGLPPKTLNNGAPGATIMEGPQATTFPGLPKFDPSSLPTLQEMLSMDTPNIGKIVDPAMPKVLPRIPNIPMPRPNMPSVPLGIQRPPKLGFGKMRQ